MILTCKACGTESPDDNLIKFYFEKGCQFLCNLCADETPEKLSRDEFNKLYWGADWLQVPGRVRAEFYDDYRSSKLTFETYLLETTEREIF